MRQAAEQIDAKQRIAQQGLPARCQRNGKIAGGRGRLLVGGRGHWSRTELRK